VRSKSICPLLIIEKAAAAPVTTWAWIGQVAPAFVAAVMVAIGWLVVEKHARRREKRADLRSAVLSLSDAVSEVRKASLAFYGLHGNDPQATSLAATIRAKIASLSDQLAILKSAGLDIDTDELLKRFRQSVTGGDFESLDRQPRPESPIAFERISADAESLTREVHIAMLRVLLDAKRESSQRSAKAVSSRPPLSSPGAP
jgi:hypothetical protein